MKAHLRTVRLELAEPLRISRSTMTARDAVWLGVEHDGVTGYGEAVSSVYYGLDADTLVRLISAVGVERFADPESALEALPSGAVPPAVIAAVESALLDLVGKRDGVPVHRMLGTEASSGVATARTIGITSPAHAAAEARRLAASGFQVIKVKAGTPDPEIEGSGTELMLGCLTASTLGLAPAVHLADRARWTDLDGHLLLAHDPWRGIGGADGCVRPSGRPGLGVEEVTAHADVA
ncbi:hypothetical protein ABZ078_33835 [Streptomyces sp. NPDC006385]|uniref:hypothetical protein n=1 Tax=Streptomyces sp. NPDC006385 TaxID=3156761 RepID=UPI0033BC5E00